MPQISSLKVVNVNDSKVFQCDFIPFSSGIDGQKVEFSGYGSCMPKMEPNGIQSWGIKFASLLRCSP